MYATFSKLSFEPFIDHSSFVSFRFVIIRFSKLQDNLAQFITFY